MKDLIKRDRKGINMKKTSKILLMILTIFMVTSCGNKSKNTEESNNSVGEEKKKIKIVSMESGVPIIEKVQEVLEEDGYTTERVLVDLNVPVMESVQDGSADCGLGVQIKFMENYNNENNGNLAMQKPYAYYGLIGLYSNKYDDISKLPDGARISIMHDSSNMDMGLRMLRDHGLIELDESFEGPYTPQQITSNQKNIEFVEVDQSQTYRMIDDLDAVIAWAGHVRYAGDDPTTALINNLDGKDYPISIIVREENEDSDWAKAVANAFHDDRVKDFVLSEYPGVYEYFNLEDFE